jgi:hypothetical protein
VVGSFEDDGELLSTVKCALFTDLSEQLLFSQKIILHHKVPLVI